jgi:multidrug efflux pump subunit AcrA (membrane-fusion protein)
MAWRGRRAVVALRGLRANQSCEAKVGPMPIKNVAVMLKTVAGIGFLLAAALAPASAAEPKAAGYAGAAVTVERPKQRCFIDAVAVSGVLVSREDVFVRPEREGLLIAAVNVEPGESVTSGQVVAQLRAPDAQAGTGLVDVRAPTAGIVLKSSAVLGTMASTRAEPLFQIVAHGEFELQAQLSAGELTKLSPGQIANIKIIGVGEVQGRVRLISSTVDGMTQLGQVRIFIGKGRRLLSGAFGRGVIVAGERCNVSIPLSAILFSQDTAFVALVRNDRIETRQIAIGLLAEGAVEVREGLSESDLVVVRAGAFVREGDRVRPVAAGAAAGRK